MTREAVPLRGNHQPTSYRTADRRLLADASGAEGGSRRPGELKPTTAETVQETPDGLKRHDHRTDDRSRRANGGGAEPSKEHQELKQLSTDPRRATRPEVKTTPVAPPPHLKVIYPNLRTT